MRLSMEERRAVVKGSSPAYKRSGKGEKGEILKRLVEATGYNRRYAAMLLRNHGRKVEVGRGKFLVGDVRAKARRARSATYGPEVLDPLKQLWQVLDFISGKRLVPAIREVLPVLEGRGDISLAPAVREKLLRISPATADRLLKKEKRRYALKRLGLTKPGTLLKRQIPIRTFSDWDEAKPGFAEVDLVCHEGGDPSGDFCCTMDLVDVATGWSEQVAVRNKAEVWVFEAIQEARQRLPFPLLGLDSDNGSEFINHHLKKYCDKEEITFTRSRPYRKNDTCHVEQKNWSIVRRFVGYSRYDTEKHLELLNTLYQLLRLYTNFFLPTMKLKEKVRDGAKVTRRYGAPVTPYRRVLASPEVAEEAKEALRQIHTSLSLVQLHREILEIQAELMREADKRAARKKRGRRAVESAAPGGKATASKEAIGFPTGAWKTPSGFPTLPTAPTTGTRT